MAAYPHCGCERRRRREGDGCEVERAATAARRLIATVQSPPRLASSARCRSPVKTSLAINRFPALGGEVLSTQNDHWSPERRYTATYRA
jgi:hypothetical protein